MRIGILEAGHAPDAVQPQHGDFAQMFERLLAGQGFAFQRYDVEGMELPAGPTECDGWLITGSKHGAYEDHPFIPPLEALIRGVVEADVPVVGICFGHQIVAQALGGRVEKVAHGWAIGKQTYETRDGPLRLNAWHQDQVVELPEGAEVLGGNAHCPTAFLGYGRAAWTTQPHPEFGDALIGAYVDARAGTGTYPDELMDAARRTAAAGEGTDAPRVARAIAAFFRDRSLHAAL
ncbi:type 1 glutamine amidotransferase [Jannaschia sp. W003]|uniref:type 1 glutamine amidotransferase n=1 Tax=Jannaschia sp. W003 TaxID=2867012 RepID=UPI0021A92900|nr:type 1 glutamine amidotransferase [Jannaschia sp. W003]UWQ22756.1 type 1 glutamine amidotransferase [Jannaschia sp. W003]